MFCTYLYAWGVNESVVVRRFLISASVRVSRRNRAVGKHKERVKGETSGWHRLCAVVGGRKDRDASEGRERAQESAGIGGEKGV